MYKQAGEGVIKDGTYIAPNGKGWDDFIAWQDGGGVLEPELSDQELAQKITDKIDAAGKKIIDQIGPASAREKDRKISRAMRLLHKKVNGQLTDGAEIQELDDADSLADTIEQIEQKIETESQWVLDESRTRQELEGYEIEAINWPE